MLKIVRNGPFGGRFFGLADFFFSVSVVHAAELRRTRDKSELVWTSLLPVVAPLALR
jgi:hypothetical protein